MRYFVILCAALALSTLPADAISPGERHILFHPQSNASAPVTGKILLVDGVSHLLQVDAVSKVCRAGGC